MKSSRPVHLSLKSRLTLLWVFLTVVCLALALILNQVYEQGTGQRLRAANALVVSSCEEISAKFESASLNSTFERSRQSAFEQAILEIVLERYEGVEGGFWNRARSFSTYAFPTYEGSGIKRDVPETEKQKIESLAQDSLQAGKLVTTVQSGQREALVLAACPVNHADSPTSLWTMTRVSISSGLHYDHLKWMVIGLIAFASLTGLGIALLIHSWTRNLSLIEKSLNNLQLEDDLELELTSDRDLNRLVRSYNSLIERLKASRGKAQAAEHKLAQAQRLSALGTMAAGVAHEIRNPLGALKLKFESALLRPEERLPAAAPFINEQIKRIDRLIQMVLAMTQPFEIRPEKIDIPSWIDSTIGSVREQALQKAVSLEAKIDVQEWTIDPFHLGRAVENVLSNAIAFTPENGRIHVWARKEDGALKIDIQDSGPGVSVEDRDKIFSAFATSRKDGFGLGLMLVREIIEAHSGQVENIPCQGAQGACFRLEVPWLQS